MSNVLIGIIGVILFIGLALAGALFLGPRFQESTNASKASAIIQSISQTANAANMYRVQEGKQIASDTAGIESLVDKGYMKVAPPLNEVVSRIIPINEGGGVTGAPSYVIANLSGSNAKAVCEAIERQSGGTISNASVAWGDKVKNQQGCYLNSGEYLAYVRI